MLRGTEKHSHLETLCLKEAMEFCGVIVRWVSGDSQLVNENHQAMLFDIEKVDGK